MKLIPQAIFNALTNLKSCLIKIKVSSIMLVNKPLMIARGKIAYQNNCASCHQVNLSGAENWKGVDEDGHRKAPPLNGTGHTWHHDDETLHKIIKYGLVGIISDYEGKMGAFGDKLNDKDIDSVLAYIKSFWPDDYYKHQINLSK